MAARRRRSSGRRSIPARCSACCIRTRSPRTISCSAAMTARWSRPGGSTGAMSSQRLLLRRATIGEIVREDGVFRAELRSAQQALNQVAGPALSGALRRDAGRCALRRRSRRSGLFGDGSGDRDARPLPGGGRAASSGFAEGWFALRQGDAGPSGRRDGTERRDRQRTRGSAAPMCWALRSRWATGWWSAIR